jgi:Ras-related protein Rab-5C
MSKVVLLGESGVGKTSICHRIQTGKTSTIFSEIHNPTIGQSYLGHDVTLPCGATVHLDVWDTAGQERFRSMVPAYCRNASGAICVYSQTDQESADAIPQWIDLFKKAAAATFRVVVVAANKQDVEGRCVDPAPMRQICEADGFLFFEVSAKTGDGITEMIESIANKLSTRIELTDEISLDRTVDIATKEPKNCPC